MSALPCVIGGGLAFFLAVAFVVWGCCALAGAIDQAEEDAGLGRRS